MIYLAYSLNHQAIYALYAGVLIKCVVTESIRQLIPAIRTRFNIMNSVDQLHAHYLPKCRGIVWSLKIPYAERVWGDLLHRSTVINEFEEVV
jgi:hypothetical protein